MELPKSVVLSLNTARVDYSCSSWDEAVGWAKGRCAGCGNPFLVIEVLQEGKHGRFIAFFRNKELEPVEWKFW